MTDAELFGCFDHVYDADGMPKLTDTRPPPPNERKLFERHCKLNCVTDPAEVERLWLEHKAKHGRQRR